MLLEKLERKIRKFIKRMRHNIFGPSGAEMLSLSRSNRAFKKEQEAKRNAALQKLLVECSKIKPQVYHKPPKRSSDDYDGRRYDRSRSSSDRDDSSAQAYQTGHLF